MDDPDRRGAPGTGPVTRAVLAGHRGDVEAAAAATRNDDPRVRVAGFGALARLGRFDARAAARAMGDDDATVRRRGCELVGRVAAGGRRWPRSIHAALVGALDDDVPLVAEAAAWSLGELGRTAGSHAVDSLAATARTHPDPLVREAAVAALGAIGHTDGLDAVIAALDDRPAVRRRAVAALAAFDDDRADVALRRSLQDRDWQVRQAAEDLLQRR